MLSEIHQLLVLQDRDQKIRQLKKDIDRIPLEEEKSRSRLDADQKAVTTAREKLLATEVAINSLQTEVGTCKDTIIKMKRQQYETRKNEEFRALANEIAAYEAKITGLEDRELEFMESAESFKTDLAAAQTRLKATQALVDEELKKLDARRGISGTHLAEVQAERAKLGANVRPDVLSLYERLFVSKGDSAVVSVDAETGSCGGCHMKVTTATLHRVRAAKEIVHCEQCSRMLYLEE